MVEHVADPYWAACPACAEIAEYGSPEKPAAHVVLTTDYDRLAIPSLLDDSPTRDEDRARMQADMTDLYRRLFKVGVTRTEGPPTE